MFGVLGTIYLLGALTLGAGLIWMSYKMLSDTTKAMARSTYKYSTAYLAFLFLVMIFDRLLIA